MKKILKVFVCLLLTLSICTLPAYAADDIQVVSLLDGILTNEILGDALGQGRGTYRFYEVGKEDYVEIDYSIIASKETVIDSVSLYKDYRFTYKGLLSTKYKEIGNYRFEPYYNISVNIEGTLPNDALIQCQNETITSSKTISIDENDYLDLNIKQLDGYFTQVKVGNGIWETLDSEGYQHLAKKSTSISIRYISASQESLHKIKVKMNDESLGEYSGITSDLMNDQSSFQLKVTPYNEITSSFDYDAYVKSVKVNGEELVGTYQNTIFTGNWITVTSDMEIEIEFAKRLVLKEGTIDYPKHGADIYKLYRVERNCYYKVSQQIPEIEASILDAIVDKEQTADYNSSDFTILIKANIAVIGDQYHELSYETLGQNWGDSSFDNEGDSEEWEELQLELQATNRYPHVRTSDLTVLVYDSRPLLNLDAIADLLQVNDGSLINEQIKNSVRKTIIQNNQDDNITENQLLQSGLTYSYTNVEFDSLSNETIKNVAVQVNIPNGAYFQASSGTITVPIRKTTASLGYGIQANVEDDTFHYFDGLYDDVDTLAQDLSKNISYQTTLNSQPTEDELPEGTMYMEYMARDDSSDLNEEWVVAGSQFETPEQLDPNNPGYYDCHLFGEQSSELMRYRYVYDDGTMIVSNAVSLNVEDLRSDTFIKSVNKKIYFEFAYDDYQNMSEEELMNQIIEGVYTSDDVKIENAMIEVSPKLKSLKIGENQKVVFTYAGDDINYKASSLTITLRINPQKVDEISASSHVLRYQENLDYEIEASVQPQMNTLHFIFGINLADGIQCEFNILDDQESVDSLNQLIRQIANVGDSSDYVPDLETFINALASENILDTKYTADAKNMMLETLTIGYSTILGNFVEPKDIPVRLGVKKPSDAGIYVHGNISADSKYELATAIGFIAIAPEHEQKTIVWEKEINQPLTLEFIQDEANANYFKSKIIEDPNDLESVISTSTIDFFYGINAKGESVFATSSNALKEGVYTQISLSFPNGNKTYSTKLITRTVTVAEKAYEVKIFEGENEAGQIVYNYGEANPLSIKVYDENGNEVLDEENVKVSYTQILSFKKMTAEDNELTPGLYIATASYLKQNSDATQLEAAGKKSALVIVSSNDLDFNAKDTIKEFDGNQHFVDLENFDSIEDFIGVIYSKEHQSLNILLTEPFNQLSEFILDAQPTAMENISQVMNMDDINQFVQDLFDIACEDIYTAADFKVELNGDKPSKPGTYEVLLDGYHYEDDVKQGVVTDATLVIEKTPITIQIDDQSIVYGEELPNFTYQIVEGELIEDYDFEVDYLCEQDGTVGTYVIDASVQDDIYDVTILTGELEITQREIVVKVDDQEIVYGDAQPTFTYEVVEGEIIAGDDLEITYTCENDGSVGNYEINATTNNENYDVTIESGSLAITKRKVTLSIDNQNIIYGESQPTFTSQITAGELIAGDDLGITYLCENDGSVGSYEINATTTNSNYDVTIEKGTYQIAKRNITLTIDNQNIIYGDSQPEFTSQISAGEIIEGDDLGITYVCENNGNVGTYEISANISNQDYHVTVVPATLTIGKREVSIKIDNQSMVYGDGQPTFTYEVVEGKIIEGDDLGVIYTCENDGSVGTYTIQATTNNDNYDVSITSGSLEILQREIVIEVEDKVIEYGDAQPTFTYKVVEGEIVEGDDLGITYTCENDGSIGSYEISAITNNDNYDVTIQSGKLEITKRKVTLIVDDKEMEYGDNQPEFTFQITSGNVIIGDDLGIIYTCNHDGSVGNFEISATTNNDKYDVTIESGSLAITKRKVTLSIDNQNIIYGESQPTFTSQITAGELIAGDDLGIIYLCENDGSVGSYEISATTSNDNYDVTIEKGTYQIAKRNITLTIDNQNIIYGDSQPEFTSQISAGELIEGDDLGIIYLCENDGSVGSYEISANISNQDYHVTVVPATLTIGKRELSIKIDNQSMVYGDGQPTFTYEVVEGEIIEGDDLGMTYTYENDGIGRYTINATSNNDNYDVSITLGIVEITKREIVIEVEDKVIEYGDAQPTFTYKVVEGEIVEGDDLGITYTCENEGSVGAYIIRATTTNPNYEVTVENGLLTIKEKVESPENDKPSKPDSSDSSKPSGIVDSSDDTNILLWIILCLISMLGVFTFKKKIKE